MKAPMNIHPPKNWQDFETLCLKLWGEIWSIPHEIEFNSDNSQGQNGVDIYGPVDGGINYNGIQCKNKKLNLIDGSPNRISIKDIQDEIDKAKGFTPALKKLVIATSLPKDRAIEEYVRQQSVLHAQNGLFTIQVCFWEFFERKLPEFESVYNWYLKNEDFHRLRQLTVTFKGGLTEKVYHPKFLRTIERYEIPPPPLPNVENSLFFRGTNMPILEFLKNDRAKFEHLYNREMLLPGSIMIEWQQNCWLKLYIANTGQAVIEDYKIELEFEGDFVEVAPEKANLAFYPNFTNDVKGYRDSKTDLYIEPRKKILVQGDSYVSGNFYLKPPIGIEAEVKLHWKLLSRDFTDSGTLLLKILPKYHTVVNRHEVSEAQSVRDEVSYSLVKRRGTKNIVGTTYHDKESDFKFE